MAYSFVIITDGSYKGKEGLYKGKNEDDKNYHNIIVNRLSQSGEKVISLHTNQFEHKPYCNYLNG